MLRLNRLILYTNKWTRTSTFLSSQQRTQAIFDSSVSCQHFSRTPIRFFDIHKIGNKEAIEKERARLADELNRGYFADISEFKKHGGKIAVANKIIIPAVAAVKFPDVKVNYSNGSSLKLPIRSDGNVTGADATLMCLSFRASSQEMINSWSMPFLEAFRDAKNVQLYELYFSTRQIWKNKMGRLWNGHRRGIVVPRFLHVITFRREMRQWSCMRGRRSSYPGFALHDSKY